MPAEQTLQFLAYLRGIETLNPYMPAEQTLQFLAYLRGIETL